MPRPEQEERGIPRATLLISRFSGTERIWRVPLAGEPRLAAEFSEGDGSPSIARHGGRLVFRRGYSDSNLWRASLKEPLSPPVRLIASTRDDAQADYSEDGSRLVFVSSRSGTREIWTANADGSNPVQITTGGAGPAAPRWSPDGKRIAFAKRPGGNADVYVVDASGGAPRRLTTDPGSDASAYWSRDGKWVYFSSNRTGRHEVWKVPADGGAPEVQLTRNGGWRSHESKDGGTLYFQKYDFAGLWRMPVEGGAETKVTDLPPTSTWYPMDTVSYRIAGSAGEEPTLRRIDHSTGRETVVRKLPLEAIVALYNFCVSPGGEFVVFPRLDNAISDLMLVENFR